MNLERSRSFPTRGRGQARRPDAIALVILLLAAMLRWTEPALVEFKYDEAHMIGLALEIARGGPFPLLSGGTSIGIERPALVSYLYALPLAVTDGRVHAAVWMQGALGVLAVGLTYCVGRRLGGRTAGIMAALYMATNPWLVNYDRKVWGHIQVVFSVALLHLAWEAVVRKRARAASAFFVVAALQCLTHVLALLQGLSWLAAILAAPKRWWQRAAGFGLLAGALLMAPYLLALGAWWVRTGARASQSAAAADRGPEIAMNLGQALVLFGGGKVISLLGLAGPGDGWWRASVPVTWLVVAAILLGVAQVLIWARRGRGAEGARLVLVWGAGPLVVLALAPQIHLQYWTVLLPLPALLFGVGIARLQRAGERWLGRPAGWLAGVAPAVAVAVVWIGVYGALLTAAGHGEARAFGVPLARWQRAADAAREWAGKLGLDQLAIAADGLDRRFDEVPAILWALLDGGPEARFVNPGPLHEWLEVRYAAPPPSLESDRQDSPGGALSSAPGTMVVSSDAPTLVLWSRPAAQEETIARAGEQLWQGELGVGREPVRLYRLPSGDQMWERSTLRIAALAGGVEPGQVRVAYALPASATLPRAPGLATAFGAPGDLDEVHREAGALQAAGVERVLLVEQPLGSQDARRQVAAALQEHYTLIAELPLEAWRAQVYVLPPAEALPVGVAFRGGPVLATAATSPHSVPAGGVLAVHLAWESGGVPLPDGLKVTVQLLDRGPRLVAQIDRPLGSAELHHGTTSYGILVPEAIEPVDLHLIVALYDGSQPGGPRLMTADGADHVELGAVRISR